MLLPEKSHAVEDLARSGASGFKPLAEVGVLALEPLHPLWRHSSRASRAVEGLDPAFGLQSAAPETRQLFAEVLHELPKLVERGFVRPFFV